VRRLWERKGIKTKSFHTGPTTKKNSRESLAETRVGWRRASGKRGNQARRKKKLGGQKGDKRRSGTEKEIVSKLKMNNGEEGQEKENFRSGKKSEREKRTED